VSADRPVEWLLGTRASTPHRFAHASYCAAIASTRSDSCDARSCSSVGVGHTLEERRVGVLAGAVLLDEGAGVVADRVGVEEAGRAGLVFGRAAAEQVIARLAGRPHVPFQTLGFELVERGRTAGPAPT
jgi:hypothetical protein